MSERLLSHEIRSTSEYYSNPSVSRAIAQFSGATNLPSDFSLMSDQFSGLSEYFAVMNMQIASEKHGRSPVRTILPASLPSVLSTQPTTEVFMSMWQKEFERYETLYPRRILFIADIEYYNKQSQHLFLEDQIGTLSKVEPVFTSISDTLKSHSIPYMSVLTGKGYHFVFQITPESEDEYLDIIECGGPISSDIRYFISHIPEDTKKKRSVPLASQQAHIGAGRLLQFLLLDSLSQIRNNSVLPVTFSDTVNEGVSLDLTPNLNRTVDTGVIGIPGSLYIKPLTRPDLYNTTGVVDRTRILSRVVRSKTGYDNFSLTELIEARQNFTRASENLGYYGGEISNANGSLRNLITLYKASSLYRLHQAIDGSEGDHWTIWPNTYRKYEDIANGDNVMTAAFLPDSHLLLKPEILRYVINKLYEDWGGKDNMSVAAHVRTFLRSAYEDPRFNWGKRFMRNNSATQAAEGWVTTILGERYSS